MRTAGFVARHRTDRSGTFRHIAAGIAAYSVAGISAFNEEWSITEGECLCSTDGIPSDLATPWVEALADFTAAQVIAAAGKIA